MESWGIGKLAAKTGNFRFAPLTSDVANVNKRNFRLLTAELTETKHKWVLKG